MDQHKKLNRQRARREGQVRSKLRRTGQRPRLTVFRSDKHIYAQIIDDQTGRTVACASTVQEGVADGGSTGTQGAAMRVGQVLAERAKAAGITQVAFDRGHYKFHGRVAALASAARQAGLEF